MIDSFYKGLEELCEELGIAWKFDGVLKNPTAEDLRQAIDRLTKDLYDDLDQAEMGGLIVQKNGGEFDVYLHVGAV